MKLLTVPALALASLAAYWQPTNPPRVVVTVADSQYLSTTRLGDILGNSTAALDVDVARQIAMLWASYHLIGMAGSKEDSLTARAVVDHAQWANFASLRFQKFREHLAKDWTTTTAASTADLYARGEIMAARHVLVEVDSTATPAQRQAAREVADALRARLTAANFSSAASLPGVSKEEDLGVFGPGAMVARFEHAVRATKPGDISGVVETEFGYHVIYRPRLEEVADQLEEIASERGFALAESTFVAQLERNHRITIVDGALTRARALARSVGAARGDQSVLVRYTGGTLTSARFAEWLEGFPTSSNVVPMLARGTDSMGINILKRIARSEIELRLADSAGIRVDSVEFEQMREALRAELLLNWNALKVGPTELSGAATLAARQRLAAARVEDYFDRMVKEESPYVIVPSSLARALRVGHRITVDETALQAVVTRARVVRATMDSIRSQQAPVPGSNPVAKPTPGGLQVAPPMRTPPSGG